MTLAVNATYTYIDRLDPSKKSHCQLRSILVSYDYYKKIVIYSM